MYIMSMTRTRERKGGFGAVLIISGLSEILQSL